jgi:hypothetical protein
LVQKNPDALRIEQAPDELSLQLSTDLRDNYPLIFGHGCLSISRINQEGRGFPELLDFLCSLLGKVQFVDGGYLIKNDPALLSGAGDEIYAHRV